MNSLINNDTIFICSYNDTKGLKSISFVYDIDIVELGKKFIKKEIWYFHKEYNTKAELAIETLDIDAFVNETIKSYNNEGQIVKSLNELRDDFKRLLTPLKSEELKTILDKINLHLKYNDLSHNYILFNDFYEANNFIKENFNLSYELDNSVFDKYHYKKGEDNNE